MPGNTKARSDRLRSIAEEIIRRENIDRSSKLTRAHIAELVQRGQCHEVTARTVFHAVLGAMRWGWTREAYSRHRGGRVVWAGQEGGPGRAETGGEAERGKGGLASSTNYGS